VLKAFLALAVLFAVARPMAAEADKGVGVTLGKIDVEDRLVGGGGYALPPLGVVNTGTEASEYEVKIGFQVDDPRKQPHPGWFDVEPRRFRLDAGESRTVKVDLTLPTGATPGDYFALIEAHIVNEGQGAVIGAAAATQLSFTVKPSSWLQAQRVRINRWIDESQPWSSMAALGALALLGLGALRRWAPIRIRVERR
jgi:MYXO-CTERM domain-containing protein